MESGHQNEGDMRLTDAQEAMFRGTNENDRAFDTITKWPKTGDVVNIPYTLDPDNKWSSYEMKNLYKAMNEFKDKTCIRYSTLANKTSFLDARKCLISSYFLLYRI